MMESQFIDRKDRQKTSQLISFIANEKLSYEGRMWDASPGGFSAFVTIFDHRAPKASIFNEILDIEDISKRLIGVRFTLVNKNVDHEPRECEVLRCERSWERDYDIFLGCRYTDDSTKVETRAEKELQGITFADEEDRAAIQALATSDPDVVNLSFPARHLYVKQVRDIAEDLAAIAGFTALEVFQIKLATDEVFTNAFKHGSPQYGSSRIRVSFMVDGSTFFARIRDEGGVPILREDIMKNIEKNPGQKSGMALIDSFMTGWTIETEKNITTTVCFYKCKDTKES